MSCGPKTWIDEILHHQHHAEGGEQLEQLRRAVDAPQQQHFDDDADEADDERREQNAGPEGDGSEGEFEQPRHQGRGRVGADHVERTVREVHDPRDAEDDRQAAGGDEQRGGAGEAVQGLNGEEGEVHRGYSRPGKRRERQPAQSFRTRLHLGLGRHERRCRPCISSRSCRRRRPSARACRPRRPWWTGCRCRAW